MFEARFPATLNIYLLLAFALFALSRFLFPVILREVAGSRPNFIRGFRDYARNDRVWPGQRHGHHIISVISNAVRNLLFPMSDIRTSISDQIFLGYPYYDTIYLFLAFASFALSRFPFPS